MPGNGAATPPFPIYIFCKETSIPYSHLPAAFERPDFSFCQICNFFIQNSIPFKLELNYKHTTALQDTIRSKSINRAIPEIFSCHLNWIVFKLCWLSRGQNAIFGQNIPFLWDANPIICPCQPLILLLRLNWPDSALLWGGSRKILGGQDVGSEEQNVVLSTRSSIWATYN